MNKPNFIFAINPDLEMHCNEFNIKNPTNHLRPEYFLPTQADPEATGYDVRCADPNGVVLRPNCYLKINLGIKMFAPPGWWLKLVPRSSTFMKKHLHALYGTIDETYENNINFVALYSPDACTMLNANEYKKIEFGERIAQVIPVQRQEMNVQGVSEEEIKKLFAERQGQRGEGGFGASGNF